MINILLCTEKIELVAAFYKALGVEVAPEQHGTGPAHFSFKSPVTAEIYPPRKDAPNAATVFRITTTNIATALSKVEDMDEKYVVSPVQMVTTGVKAIVQDPDGRRVELFQPR